MEIKNQNGFPYVRGASADLAAVERYDASAIKDPATSRNGLAGVDKIFGSTFCQSTPFLTVLLLQVRRYRSIIPGSHTNVVTIC
jgi:hypothetical protein